MKTVIVLSDVVNGRFVFEPDVLLRSYPGHEYVIEDSGEKEEWIKEFLEDYNLDARWINWKDDVRVAVKVDELYQVMKKDFEEYVEEKWKEAQELRDKEERDVFMYHLARMGFEMDKIYGFAIEGWGVGYTYDLLQWLELLKKEGKANYVYIIDVIKLHN